MAGYQILGVRSFYDEKSRKQKKYDAFFEQRWRFDDIAEVFKDPLAILDRNKIPADERWNLFYTVNLCGTGKREFKSMEILPFDLDGIDVERKLEYIPVVLKVLKVDPAKTAIVFSGNGLHFLIKIFPAITDKGVFNDRRSQYKAICAKINSELERLRLPGKADTAVFDAARILRFPLTLNRKPSKTDPSVLIERKAEVIASILSAQPFDFDEISEAPKLDSSQAISQDELRRYKRNPGNAAMEECLFLKHARDDAATLPEPEWYSAASIIGRFDKGRELFHEISKGHPHYSPGVTDAKLDQAIEASGPRTCENINTQWGGCKSCPLWGKIKSPVVIFGKDVIPTEATGFYDVINTPQGPKIVPNYNDLLAAWKRDKNYFVDIESKRIWIFDKTHWRRSTDLEVRGYAEAVMEPKPKKTIRNEFSEKVLSSHQWFEKQTRRFFADTVVGKINLQNGILDPLTGKLEDHSSDYGFTYVLPYNHAPEAKAPTFLRFLNEITLGRKDLQETLLDFMGYCLLPRYDDHCFLWLTGTGRNGKSTYMELLQEMLGEDNVTSVMLDQFEDENYLEMMNRKLLNFSEEADGKKIPAKVMGPLKALSAGGTIMVSQKYLAPYNMRGTAKLVFASNTTPNLEHVGQAIASRMIVVPFDLQLEDFWAPSQPSRVDASLKDQMLAEMPGILNIALERIRLRAGKRYKIHRGEETKAAAKQIFLDSDSVQKWLVEHVDFVPENTVPFADLYQHYLTQVDDERYAVAKVTFAKRLREKLGRRIEDFQQGKNRVRMIKGLQLRGYAASDKSPDTQQQHGADF